MHIDRTVNEFYSSCPVAKFRCDGTFIQYSKEKLLEHECSLFIHMGMHDPHSKAFHLCCAHV